MDKYELSRRKILAGLASAGGSGALLGTGTMALFSDEPLFANNSLNAGAIRLAVGNDANSDSEQRIFEVDMDDSGETTFPVTLPKQDRQGTDTNPAYVWFGTSGCPDDPPSDFADALDVKLSYACGNNQNGDIIIEERKLGCFIEELRGGFQIDPGCTVGSEPGCLEPEESVELRLEWTLGDYQGDEYATLDFEFVAEQCRHSNGETNPFPTTECDAGKDISWVAFCADSDSYEDGDDGKLRKEDVEFSIDGPELTLSGIADPESLNAVLLKDGTSLEEFTPENATAPNLGSDDEVSFTTVPCGPDGWTVTSYEQDTGNGSKSNGYKKTERTNREPCLDGETGFKYEVDDGGGS